MPGAGERQVYASEDGVHVEVKSEEWVEPQAEDQHPAREGQDGAGAAGPARCMRFVYSSCASYTVIA
jgi:hypothetical protein